jgi:hypothetical protein
LAFCSEARLDQPETNLAENRFNGKQNPEDDSPLKLNRSIQSFAQAGVYSAEMKIVPQLDDDPEFVRRVELTVNGILRSHSPASLAVIKIDNWFGARWLGFSGKFGGIAGFTLRPSFRTRKRLRIPPFVPERVVFQRRFCGPEFEEIDSGKPVHLHVPSSVALRRMAAVEEPDVALAWFSGKSKKNDRGALMMYIPAGDSYWAWYAELQRAEPWRITKAWEIKHEDLSNLMDEASDWLAEAPTR